MILSRRRFFESRRHGGPYAPALARGLGAAQAPSGVQGQSPVGSPGGEAPGSKMNLRLLRLSNVPLLRAILTR